MPVPNGIDALLVEILADANGDDEELRAFEQALATSARVPFPARVAGVPIEVADIVYEGNVRRGLIALCLRDGASHRVSLADVVPGPVTLETARLLNAYRRWCGMEPVAAPKVAPSASKPWSIGPWP